jgi:hypothetical protein
VKPDNHYIHAPSINQLNRFRPFATLPDDKTPAVTCREVKLLASVLSSEATLSTPGTFQFVDIIDDSEDFTPRFLWPTMAERDVLSRVQHSSSIVI